VGKDVITIASKVSPLSTSLKEKSFTLNVLFVSSLIVILRSLDVGGVFGTIN
jgi:hypothetical protein